MAAAELATRRLGILGLTGFGREAAATEREERDDARDRERDAEEDADEELQQAVLEERHADGRCERAAEDQDLRETGRRDEDGDADEHADRREAEAVVPTPRLTDVAAEDR